MKGPERLEVEAPERPTGAQVLPIVRDKRAPEYVPHVHLDEPNAQLQRLVQGTRAFVVAVREGGEDGVAPGVSRLVTFAIDQHVANISTLRHGRFCSRSPR